MFFIRARRLWSRHANTEFEHADWRGRSVNVYVHHTADSGPRGGAGATAEQEHEYLRNIEGFHISTRGWRAIGYSYIVMPSGRVYEGRGWEKVGAHTLDPKDADHDGVLNENRDIGICFAGNFDHAKPTKRALLAYRLLRARLKLKGARLDRTYPHRATYATSCPGDNLVRALNL